MKKTTLFVALAAMAFLVGVAIKGALASAKRVDVDDDVMARASRVGNSAMPEFVARIARRRRAEKVRSELPDALDMVSNSLSVRNFIPSNCKNSPVAEPMLWQKSIAPNRSGCSME